MGKSTTARLFAEAGDAVYDADLAVHRLYRGKAVAPVEAEFPGVAVDGEIDRAKLGALVINNAEAMARLEAIVHPLVRAEEAAFLAAARGEGRPIAVLDIPLLFETKQARRVRAVAVVSAPAEVQRARVLARPGMTEERFEAIRGRQMADAEKRRNAHFVIDTGESVALTRSRVVGVRRALLSLG